MVLLSTIALVLSSILCIHALSGAGLIGCSAGTSCNEVLGSRWSFLFRVIPVSGLAALCYIVMTLTLIFRHSFDDDPEFARWIERGIIILSGAILGAAIWFIWLQKNYIRAFCPYCMSAHICGIILSIMIMLRSSERLWKRLLLLLCGLLMAAALAGAQLLTTPRTAYDRGFVNEDLPVMGASSLPVIGDPKAEKTVTLLFDYRCSHCQKIHSLLPEVVRELGGRVAIVTCPVPISLECNPYIHATEDRFAGSCEIDKLALAVWRVDRSAFAEFDSWLFGSESASGWYPRDPDEARAKAASLVGSDRLDEALSDPWIASYLSEVFELFGRTSSAEKSAIPRFIYGNRWLVPDADSASGLAALLSSLTD